jgi:hypothetical protein
MTGLCSTIQIQELLFNDYRKLGYPTWIKFGVKQQLLNIKLIKLNHRPGVSSINVNFD